MLLALSVSTSSSLNLPPKSAAATLTKSAFHGIRLGCLCPSRAPCQSVALSFSRTSSSVLMMAKREEELKEIRTKTTEELNEEIVDLKGELFMLRLQKSVRNEFQSSEFRRMRKRIARMLTVKREREIEEGIGKRLSRKLDRKWKQSIVVRPPPSLLKLREEEEAEEAEKTA